MANEVIPDIICQVYAGDKSVAIIHTVLNKFLPGYEKLNVDYAFKPDDPKYVFKTEDEMVNYFLDKKGLEQTFYWNKYQDNPDKIMVGANITTDDKLVISLTFDGNSETKFKYFQALKNLLNSEIGVITYVNPAEYKNGEDFIKKYK
ncbi:MAG TPA: hypothetical protein VEC36_01020 [Patescibacteria group bacterium]|nr:hypothetical protein [Patescibacteria group bacterium]